jgi:hypothetical protein
VGRAWGIGEEGTGEGCELRPARSCVVPWVVCCDQLLIVMEDLRRVSNLEPSQTLSPPSSVDFGAIAAR